MADSSIDQSTPGSEREDGGNGRPHLLPPALLQSGETILLELKPAPAMIFILSCRWLLCAAVIILANELTSLDRLLFSGARQAAATLAVGIVLAGLTLAASEWLCRVYVLTDRRILRQRGIIHVNIFECPLARVQDTYLDFSWLERLLGLGTLSFQTASGTLASWAFISRPLDVHHRVVEAIQQGKMRKEE